MVKVDVNPGICGFITVIKVESEDMQNATIQLETQCPNIKPMVDELKTVDAYEECFSKTGDSKVFELSQKYCRHPSCPVPSAIIKGIEVACCLALPKDVEIKITKVDL